ncbi:hypothetical protein [Larkinella soli]|uniref:hypothetical protein n=1 Tax=Larkinella soli TaxID=1770527 RepID=UPI000FFC7885|nr:hypothetical protein [Larkinella soli]
MSNLIKLPSSSLLPPAEAFQGEAETDHRELHFNYIQLLCLLIGAQHLKAVAGRGTGKSEGILAPRVHTLVEKMPRSSLVVVGTTYIQLLDRTLPALWNGLHKLGYERDVDYWVRRFPDKKLKLELPYNCPLDPQHAIFIRNGNTVTALRLVGQDRPGTANGLSVNAILGDEAKFLNKEKLDSEVMAINRGDNERFGEIAEHHSTTFTTDMPTSRDARWILEDETECLKPHHQKAIRLILAVQLQIYTEKQKLQRRPGNQSAIARIRQYERMLNELRKGLVHFAEASSFANVHALGLQYFRQLYRTLNPATWNANVLNNRVRGVKNGFYPHLQGTKHYYDSIDYAYVDSVDFGVKGFNDCRKDGDIDPNQPLTIGMDYGSSFNCMVVGQRVGNEVRYQKIFYADGNYKIHHVVRQFTTYYRYFYRKEVTYVYNHTAIGTDGKSDITYASEVIDTLEKEGWSVRQVYTGQTESHMSRYLAWNIALSEEDDRFPRQRFNRENTRVLVDAMHDAGTKEGSKGFRKDKNAERDPDVDQSTTTHLTDAADEVFYYLTITELGIEDLLPLAFSQ